jgi:hypothetical protein
MGIIIYLGLPRAIEWCRTQETLIRISNKIPSMFRDLKTSRET